MNKKLQRRLAIACAVLTTTGLMSLNAANLTKKVNAVYNNIKVTYNGQEQTPQYEPFMIDGTVYVSLRDAGTLTNNSVNWDGTNKTVQMASKGPSVSDQELASKNLEIATLKNQVASLQKQVDYYKNLEQEQAAKPGLDSAGLTKMEGILVDNFGSYLRIDWDFDLNTNSKGDTILLTVDYESRYDGTDYDSLSSSKLEGFLEDLCEEIRANYKDVAIEGEVYDLTKKTTKCEFEYSTKNQFTMVNSISKEDIDDLEDDLNYDYSYFKGFTVEPYKTRNIKINEVELSTADNNTTIIASLYTDVADRDEWNDFMYSPSRTDRKVIEDLVDDMYDDIEYATGAKNITIIVYTDTEKMMAKYEEQSLTLMKIR